MTPEDIIKRQEAMETDRQSSVAEIWQFVERFIAPFKGEFYRTINSEIDWRKRQIYDTTAVEAAENLAAAIHSNLTSPSALWFRYQFRDDELNSDDAAMEWLEECGKRVWRALQDSSFNLEIAEHFHDLVTIGTAALVEEWDEDEQELRFQHIPISEMTFEEDHSGKAVRMYRKLMWTPVQILDRFPDAPEAVKKRAEQPNGATERMTVIFALYIRPEKQDADTSSLLAPEARPVGYTYVLKDTGDVLDEGGYYELPVYVTRFRKIPGSKWGRAPGFSVMATIMDVNELIETELEAAAKEVDGPLEAVERNIIGDLDLERSGVTMVSQLNSIKPIYEQRRSNWADNQILWMREAIRRAFYQDQLDLKESPAMTATEVNARRQLMLRLLGPALGRIQSDLLDPLLERTFYLLYRAGLLPEMPQSVKEAQNGTLDIEYLGSMPRAQQELAAMSLLEFAQVTASLAEFYPRLRHLFDPEEGMREWARIRGVPAKAIRGEEEVQGLVEQDQKQAQAQQQLALIQAGAEAIGKAGPGAKAMAEAEQMGGGVPQPQVGGAA